MEPLDDVLDDVMAILRRRLGEVAQAMRAARDPHAFTDAERKLVSLAHEFAADLTGRIVGVGELSEGDFWDRNRERLRYGSFRTRGIPIGSGAVESSARRVINLRMKSASVTWLEEHAEGLLHLRAHAKSGRWKELEAAVLAHCQWRPTARAATRTA